MTVLFDVIHEDDLEQIGFALDSVSLMRVNWARVKERARTELQTRIAERKRREHGKTEKSASDAGGEGPRSN